MKDVRPMRYSSVSSDTAAELEIKKSRFITRVSPVNSQEEAEQILSDCRLRWPGATHYCFAWITKVPLMERCSDDGEPSGTAGLPILTVLKARGLENIIAVVIRYFGGTLLGASGLVRAYSDSVRNALDNSQMVQYEPGVLVQITVDYTDLGLLQHRFLSVPEVQTENMEYGERVVIGALLAADNWVRWEKDILEMTAGRAEITIIGDRMVASLV